MKNTTRTICFALFLLLSAHISCAKIPEDSPASTPPAISQPAAEDIPTAPDESETGSPAPAPETDTPPVFLFTTAELSVIDAAELSEEEKIRALTEAALLVQHHARFDEALDEVFEEFFTTPDAADFPLSKARYFRLLDRINGSSFSDQSFEVTAEGCSVDGDTACSTASSAWKYTRKGADRASASVTEYELEFTCADGVWRISSLSSNSELDRDPQAIYDFLEANKAD